MTSPGGLVTISAIETGIFEMALNRPEKRNALSIELREDLTGELDRLGRREDCTGIVLSGRGAAFCAGMDFTQFGGDRENRERLYRSTVRCFAALLTCPKPIVAAVHGAAVGGGFALALCCDARLASPDAFFGFYEVRRGIPAPRDLVHLFVTEAVTRDWCETGRRIEASEARACGVVEVIVEADELVGACARLAATVRKSERRERIAAVLAEEMRLFGAALFGAEGPPPVA